MNKTQARAFLKRAREGIRDAETALAAGDLHRNLLALDDDLGDAVAAPEAIRSDYIVPRLNAMAAEEAKTEMRKIDRMIEETF